MLPVIRWRLTSEILDNAQVHRAGATMLMKRRDLLRSLPCDHYFRGWPALLFTAAKAADKSARLT